MKTFVLIAMLALATLSHAQAKCTSPEDAAKDPNCHIDNNHNVVYVPTPLKCDKNYQHIENDCLGPADFCNKYGNKRCVDNIHRVTEREWHDLQEEIKTLHEALKLHIQAGSKARK